MVQKLNDIINNKSFEIIDSYAVIQRKIFLNEVIRSHDLIGLIFAHVTFLDCNFVNIDFRYANFISCDFTNCNFTETLFLKSELHDCNFKNCKISQSDLTRADIMESHFIHCQFDDVIMGGAYLIQCELIQPKFHKVHSLASVTLKKLKISNSKKCIEVNKGDNVSKIVDDLKE